MAEPTHATSQRRGPVTTAAETPRAVLLGVSERAGDDASRRVEESLEELARLAETAGATVVSTATQRLPDDSGAYMGKGKLEEVHRLIEQTEATLAITDDELRPSQQRQLEDALGVPVLDRTALILDIFAQHARTREGALQVELAQLRYRLPRLSGHDAGSSRLGGGIGTRGPGETQLESDRRRIRARIGLLRRELMAVRDQRTVQRRWRRRQGVPVVAIVGYTNVGKSTLLNRLTGADVRAEDRLFATLDPTTRTLQLPHRQQALITDTVGFIQKLPPDLIEAFKATLEEVTEADILLHVVDVSSPTVLDQALAVYEILKSIGAGEKRVVTALNKVDALDDEAALPDPDDFPNPVLISAARGDGFERLVATVAAVLAADFRPVEILVPYGERELLDVVHLRGAIDAEEYRPTGTYIRGRVPAEIAAALRGYGAS